MSLRSIVDSHTHSIFSPDGQMSLEEGIIAAHNRGMGGLVFTDHIELAHPDIATWNTPFDIEQRSHLIDQLRHEHASNIKIFKGIELGFEPTILDRANEMINQHDLDLVILSTHCVDNIDLGEKSYYQGRSKEQAYTKYLDTIYQSVSMFDNFDVVGHIGYACRYACYPDKSLCYLDYHDKLDAILNRIIAQGKGIEVNTAGFRLNLGYPHPDYDVIKRYHELGGTIITLGSDAHRTLGIGREFENVIKRLADIGFKYVAHFEQRKPVFVPIGL
ncbi:MAG: histidinol-phosphatase HisJ family protein [Candidatus Babeliales bacterium]|jgi:histidinol-phosphatase (PHP family)